MHNQTSDLGLSCHELEEHFVTSGYWAGSDLRKRNACVLSPSAYVVSAEQRARLDTLAKELYCAVQTLSAVLSRLASMRSLSNEEARFLAMAKSAQRGLLLPHEVASATPPIMKVDLVQDPEGRYFIAEVDAYNPRGLGYLALVEDGVPDRGRIVGSGISSIAEMLRARVDANAEWIIVVSDRERYYMTAFDIFRAMLVRAGVKVQVIREEEIQKVLAGKKRVCVFMIPETLFQNLEGRDALLQLYREGNLRTFFPPTAYLGSKAFLPFLSQQRNMNDFIPTTWLVSKRDNPTRLCNGSRVVLKAVMSSGFKGVMFSDDTSGEFSIRFAEALRTCRPSWVLQKEVPQAPIPIIVFDENGQRREQDYFLRITAYVAEDGVVGAAVTGRPDKAVHGAPDCIQLPMIMG